jgi:hypothetical protein
LQVSQLPSFHNQVSAEHRREDMLVREMDGIPLPFTQAE